jgi:hypothetical protein
LPSAPCLFPSQNHRERARRESLSAEMDFRAPRKTRGAPKRISAQPGRPRARQTGFQRAGRDFVPFKLDFEALDKTSSPENWISAHLTRLRGRWIGFWRTRLDFESFKLDFNAPDSNSSPSKWNSEHPIVFPTHQTPVQRARIQIEPPSCHFQAADLEFSAPVLTSGPSVLISGLSNWNSTGSISRRALQTGIQRARSHLECARRHFSTLVLVPGALRSSSTRSFRAANPTVLIRAIPRA